MYGIKVQSSEHALFHHDVQRQHDQALALHRALADYIALQGSGKLGGKGAALPVLSPSDYTLAKCRWALGVISTRSFATSG